MAQDLVRRAMRLEAVLEALGLSRSAFYAGIKKASIRPPPRSASAQRFGGAMRSPLSRRTRSNGGTRASPRARPAK